MITDRESRIRKFKPNFPNDQPATIYTHSDWLLIRDPRSSILDQIFI